MIANRSIPAATVIPVFVYPDVRAAVEWLSVAFGFQERVRIREDHRAQLQMGSDPQSSSPTSAHAAMVPSDSARRPVAHVRRPAEFRLRPESGQHS